jgi:galactitol-specific phosphotransferase system IIC component
VYAVCPRYLLSDWRVLVPIVVLAAMLLPANERLPHRREAVAVGCYAGISVKERDHAVVVVVSEEWLLVGRFGICGRR